MARVVELKTGAVLSILMVLARAGRESRASLVTKSFIVSKPVGRFMLEAIPMPPLRFE